MSVPTQGILTIAAVIFVTTFGLLMVVLRTIKVPRPGRDLRPLRALSRLRHAVNLTVESGKRLHISLGRGEITHPRTAAAFVGLKATEQLMEQTVLSDRPTVITSGTGVLGILARDTLHSAYRTADEEARYRSTYGRVTGLTPFSYAAGTLRTMQDKHTAANFLIGSFGPEIALMADADVEGALTIGGTDSIAAQAVLCAAADETLIGEEVFASGAYLGNAPLHGTSLLTQDIFRWVIIFVIVGGALVKMLGAW